MQAKILTKHYWGSINCGCATSGCHLESLKCTETYGTKNIYCKDVQTVPNFIIIKQNGEVQLIGYLLMCEREQCIVISMNTTDI